MAVSNYSFWQRVNSEISCSLFGFLPPTSSPALQAGDDKKIDKIGYGNIIFTDFSYPDTMEKGQ